MRMRLVLILLFIVSKVASDDVRNVHLALTGNLSTMAVSWATQNPTKETLVKYGVSSTLDQISYGTQTTYNASVGYFHNVVLTRLSPDTSYYFRVGGSSQIFTFKTGLAKNFQRKVVIPTLGDMGVRNSNTTIPRLIDLAESGNVDFFLHVGDISYADDYPSWRFESIWEEWFRLMTPVLEGTPYMVCAGNHESVCQQDSCSNYTGHFAPYIHRFRMPYKESGSTSNMQHSWNYGGIHFIAINTETDYNGSPEPKEGGFGDWLAWLEKDLSNIDRSETPWVVVFGHRPVYSTSRGYADMDGNLEGYAKNLQLVVEELFNQYKVDLYICGHIHTYERSLPVYHSKAIGNYPDKTWITNPQAPIYIVSGAGGCAEGLSNTDWNSWEWGSSNWSWYGNRFGDDYGYGIINVHNSTFLHWQFFSSGENSLQDEFYIVRS